DYRFQDATAAVEADPHVWWNAFDDPTLNALVDEALANNRDLRIASARVDEAAAIVSGTQAQGLPQVGYSVQGSRQRTSDAGSSPFVGDVRSSLGGALLASWEIDLWGRIARETEAARANLLATDEARRGVVLTLISSVIVGYLNLLDLDERLRISEETVEGRRQYVELFEKRLRGGVISDFEMAQVRAEYETTLATLPELRRQIALQEDALSVLLGRNPGSIERPATLDTIAAPAVPGGLPSELLTRRPDILQAEQVLVASNASIGAVRARYFPRISLTSLLGLASTALGGLFEGASRTWQFAGEIAGPIYTGGGLEAATAQALARREQALAAYERTIQDAFRDTDDALVSLQTADESQEIQRRRVDSLALGVRLARDRYENGYSSTLDLLDTERGLLSAQLALTAARADRYRALVCLYRALGGDWIDEPELVARADAGELP
ncbi:MAG TPA: efflux transporter outer membrane subunit, partial [Croceibacterium sp.]|nr:efflux transporter outer membrane subunit [Croceibacterium sp.]